MADIDAIFNDDDFFTEIDKPKEAYKEKFVDKFNIRDLNFATKNITYAQIFFNER